MSNKDGLIIHNGGAIRLDDDDIRLGMALELECTRLQSQLEGVQRSAQLLTALIFERYGVTPHTHQLSDWLKGLEPISRENGLMGRNGGNDG